MGNNFNNDDKICSVCLDYVTRKRKFFALLDICNHVFCSDCIRKCVNMANTPPGPKCPVCRIPFSKFAVASHWPQSESKKLKLLKSRFKSFKTKYKIIPNGYDCQ